MRNVQREQWEHGAGQTDTATRSSSPLPLQLWPRGLPRGPCPTQGPSCSSLERGLGCSGPQNPRVCNRDRKTKKRNQDSPTPKEAGGENGASHSPTTELSFPTLRRAAQSPTPHRSLASPSPALQATRGGGGGGGEGQPDGHPLHLGRHVGASQSRLQVGIHHGLTVRRLDVVGGFLELQQHGHLRGAVHGTQPRSPRPPKLPTPESSSTE